MGAFVTVRVMDDDGSESKRAIRACDVYEIEDCEHYRVIRRIDVDDLFVLDKLEQLKSRIEIGSNNDRGGRK